MDTQYAYDTSGRLVREDQQLNRPWTQSDQPQQGNYVYFTGTRLKTYDAENRLRSDTYTYDNGGAIAPYGTYYGGGYWGHSVATLPTIDYTADAHPVRFSYLRYYNATQYTSQTLMWLWDGNAQLSSCFVNPNTAQCPPVFSVEGLADYTPSANTLTVNDRDLGGRVVTTHDRAGFTGWRAAPRPFQWLAKLSPVAPDSAAFGTTPFPSMGMLTADGWSVDNDTWQSVRTFDATVGQWNTPDAYAGNVHDPMTHKPYMWNGNNPYAYSDPSGYCFGPWDFVPWAGEAAAGACAVVLAVGAAATKNGPAIVADTQAPGTGAGLSAAGSSIALNSARAALAESTVRSAMGWQKATVFTTLGTRFVDGFDPLSGSLHELKIGTVGTDGRVMSEVAKDAELVKGGLSVTWHFFDSVLTGQGGPTPALRDALAKAGIKIDQHNLAF